MSRHEEMCPHCRAKTGLDTSQAGEAAEPIVPELPDLPTPMRVHASDRPPFDCTLHPDGTLTAVLAGELRRNFFTFAEMRETNWADAHFELNPPPLVEEPEPGPVVEAVQDALL
jgi:hypothetical protein